MERIVDRRDSLLGLAPTARLVDDAILCHCTLFTVSPSTPIEPSRFVLPLISFVFSFDLLVPSSACYLEKPQNSKRI